MLDCFYRHDDVGGAGRYRPIGGIEIHTLKFSV